MAVQAGHELAFQELYQPSSLSVLNTISRVSKNREDAKYALQNSVMKTRMYREISLDQRS